MNTRRVHQFATEQKFSCLSFIFISVVSVANLIHYSESLNWTSKTYLNPKTSLKTGFKVFLCTFVLNFFLLSGKRHTLTYGSLLPFPSLIGKSLASKIWKDKVLSTRTPRILRFRNLITNQRDLYVRSSRTTSCLLGPISCPFSINRPY